MKNGRFWLLVLVALLLVGFVLASSITLLPNPPLYPTPTFPKAIDFPNERPVPYR
jgi:hypothetical protein